MVFLCTLHHWKPACCRTFWPYSQRTCILDCLLFSCRGRWELSILRMVVPRMSISRRPTKRHIHFTHHHSTHTHKYTVPYTHIHCFLDSLKLWWFNVMTVTLRLVGLSLHIIPHDWHLARCHRVNSNLHPVNICSMCEVCLVLPWVL